MFKQNDPQAATRKRYKHPFGLHMKHILHAVVLALLVYPLETQGADTNQLLRGKEYIPESGSGNSFKENHKETILTGSTVVIDQSKGIMLSNGEDGLDSNVQDKKSLLDNDDVGTALIVAPAFPDQSHELILYEGDSCEQAKTHAAVGTAIIAGIATIAGLYLDPVGSAIRISVWVAGISTAGNGLTNYISCDGSDFIMDSAQVELIAKRVYNTGTAAGLRTEVTDAFARFDNSILFQQSLSTLKDRIGYFSSIVSRMKREGVDIETADLMFTVTAYLSSLYQMSIFKKGSDDEKQGDPDPGVSIQSEGGDSCMQYVREYRAIVHDVKEYMDQYTWERQSAAFKAEAKCVTVSGEYPCYDLDNFQQFISETWEPGVGTCYFWEKTCSATYGRHDYKKVIVWRNCSDRCSPNRTKPYVPYDENTLLTEQFKPRYDAWYNKIKDDWNKIIELDAELQQQTEEQHEHSMCGKYVKPLCMPYFFYDADIEYCCDNEESLRCGNFEGTCSTTRNECKDGFVCRPLNEILRERPSEESLILQRTAWKKGDNPNVCYKAGEPIPGPFDEDAITPYPTSKPTRSPVKPPPPPPPSPGPCFSSTSMVNHMSHGLVPISDINIGDSVQSKSDGSFSRVYALEKNHYGESQFYQFHTSKGVALELTDRHMVYLKDRSLPVPARDVRVGDVLKSDDHSEEVTKIEVIHQDGYYNPLTEDGTIILNDGVVASSFSVAKSSSSEFFDGPTGMIHWHSLSHLGNAPLRFVCKAVSFNLCTDEQYLNEEGLHKFIVFLKTLSNLPNWQKVIGFPFVISIILTFAILEYFYNLVGEAFYETISSTSAEAAAQDDGSFGFLFTFSLTVAALVPSAIFLWRKKYHLSCD